MSVPSSSTSSSASVSATLPSTSSSFSSSLPPSPSLSSSSSSSSSKSSSSTTRENGDGTTRRIPHSDDDRDTRSQLSRPSFQAILPEYLASASFMDRELALEKLNQFASEQGFQVSIRSSVKGTTYLCCRRARYPAQIDSNRVGSSETTSSSSRSSSYVSFTKCPYSIKIAACPYRPDHFVLRTVNPSHNHAPFPEGFDADTARRARSAKRPRIERSDPEVNQSVLPATFPQPSTPSGRRNNQRHTVEEVRQARNMRSVTIGAAPHSTLARATRHESQELDSESLVVSNASSARTDATAIRGLLSLSFNHQRSASVNLTPSCPRPTTGVGVDSKTSTAVRGDVGLNASASVPASAADACEFCGGGAGGRMPGRGSESSATNVLQGILQQPPYDSTMAEVEKLDMAQAKRALEWAKMLVGALDLRVNLITNNSSCNSATTAPNRASASASNQ